MTRQFNVPLSERQALILKTVTVHDDRTVPEVLRPVVEKYLDERLAADADLRAAVQAHERARARNAPKPVTQLRSRNRTAATDGLATP